MRTKHSHQEDALLTNPESNSILTNDFYILVVLSSIPVLNFTAFNIGETGFSPSRSLVYIIALSALSITLYFSARFLIRSLTSNFISLSIGLSVLITFYGYFIDSFIFGTFLTNIGIRPRIIYVGMLYGFIILLCVLCSFLITKRKNILTILIFSLSAMGAVDVYSIARSYPSYLVNAKKHKDIDPLPPAPSSFKAKNNIQRNVYFILPDMMFGPEMFAKFGIEQNVLDGIKKRGFTVLNKSYSNAPVTEFSIPHIFTMEHYLNDGDVVSTEELHELTSNSRKNNKVVSEFKKRGYETYAISDGYINMCLRGEYICASKITGRTHQQQDLRFIERTPFFKILNVLDMKFNIFDTPMNMWAYPNRMEIPELLTYLEQNRKQPYFLYIHLGLPHFPLRFDRDCNYKRFDKTEVGYAEQYRCTTKYLELLIDNITRMDEKALIVMHADHGVMIQNQHLKQVGELSEDEIRESLSILNAFRLPDECETYINQEMTPVNTFRLVFACLDNSPPEYTHNTSFLVYYPKWPSGGRVRKWEH